MNQVGKVFLACAFGAFIGALMALQVAHSFWWIGLVAGFSVGYLIYEFKTLITTIPAAWRNSRISSPGWGGGLRRIVVSIGSGLTQGFAFVFAVLLWKKTFFGEIPTASIEMVAMGFGIVCAILTVYTCYLIPPEMCRSDKERRENFELEIEGNVMMANPFRIYLWTIPSGILKMLWWSVRRIFQVLWTLTKFCGRFLRALVRMTHSEIRLLCGLDAAIGTAVGYHFDSALLGAIIGGLWGVLNFELLSIRILKLVPQTRSLFHR